MPLVLSYRVVAHDGPTPVEAMNKMADVAGFVRPMSRCPERCAILLGVAMTLAVRGYRFGESNHAVYLVDAIRRADPSLLAHDWWVQSTLQYHFVFSALTAGLMRMGLLEPAFLAGYLALAVLLHVAWRAGAALGGGDGTYLVSVVLFYALAGGVGLGMYHFLQDSAFLPSNVANVAMLWGIYFWIVGKPASAGVCLGVAGLFHINHAWQARRCGEADAPGRGRAPFDGPGGSAPARWSC